MRVAPALELAVKKGWLYGKVALPVYQRVNGEQPVAPALFELALSRRFCGGLR